MKPIPAIVERVQIDVEELTRQIDEHLATERLADRQIAEHERLAAEHSQAAIDARAVRRQARLSLGALLNRVRVTWPDRGPKAKGWGEYLERRGLADSTARMYMDEARDPEGFAEKRRAASAKTQEPGPEPTDDDHGQYGPRLDPLPDPDRAAAAPFRKLTESELIQAIAEHDADARKRIIGASKVSPHGASGEKERGAWCTPEALAVAVGPWDLDPFTNPRSHIAAAARCMLEDGGDGFGDRSQPGSYRDGRWNGTEIATAYTRVWIQPPYERGFVRAVVDHYKHTRFCALLRWSPDVEWFAKLWPHVRVVAFPTGERIEFKPPPNVETTGDGGTPFPHALFYADERDVTDEVRAMCLVWRVEHPTNEPAAAPMSDAAAISNTTTETA